MRAIFGMLSMISLFVISGCTPAPDEELKVSERECTTISIHGTWKAVALKKTEGGLQTIPSREEIFGSGYSSMSITIPDEGNGIAAGTNFLNVIGFDFKIEDQNISFGINKIPGRSSSSEDSWSSFFTTNLQAATSFCFSDEKLYFLNDENEDLIAFEKSPSVTLSEVPDYSPTSCGTEAFQGKWRVTKVRLESLDELRDIVNPDFPMPGRYMRITISATGISGNTFNNWFGGTFKEIDEQQFFIGSMLASRAMDEFWGAEFMNYIESRLTYCLTGNELAMFNEDGKTVLVFERVVESE